MEIIKGFKILVIETNPCLRPFSAQQRTSEKEEEMRRNHAVIATLS
jgi:hypothetical protein